MAPSPGSSEPSATASWAIDKESGPVGLEGDAACAGAAINWYELAWLARHGRISVSLPVDAWLRGLARSVRTVALSPAIAATAVALPRGFPSDPADRCRCINYVGAILMRCIALHKRGYCG